MEKKTVFIKVNCIDRLPLVSGYYHTDKGIVHYSDIFEDWNSDNIDYWLEEIELPSKEEINKFWCQKFKKGAMFILNKLNS